MMVQKLRIVIGLVAMVCGAVTMSSRAAVIVSDLTQVSSSNPSTWNETRDVWMGLNEGDDVWVLLDNDPDVTTVTTSRTFLGKANNSKARLTVV